VEGSLIAEWCECSICITTHPRAALSPSRTPALYWDQYQVLTYTGLITDAPPVIPTLHLAAKLLRQVVRQAHHRLRAGARVGRGSR
jgi:hypothetical protein